MLTTLLHPSAGRAEICGHDIVRQRNEVRQDIGVVFQEPALDPELTGEENLDFHARIYGLRPGLRSQRIKEVLALVNLIDKKDARVKQYSGGMKRRLEIARGLIHSPAVLFLDEPTLGLDAQTRRAIWEYIKKMNAEEKTTVFLTTHYMDEADFLCDRIGIIDQGRLLVLDSVDRLKSSLGGDVLSLTCMDTPKLSTRLAKESWVKHMTTQGETLTFATDHGEEKIPLVMDIARSQQISIHSITIRKPTLDDVFLYYTGRNIRDKEQEASVKVRRKRWGVRRQ